MADDRLLRVDGHQPSSRAPAKYRKMKILWVGHSGRRHGAERTMFDAVKSLSAAGHHIRILLPSDREMDPLWADLAVPVDTLDLRWWVSHGRWRLREFLSWLRRTVPATIRLVRSTQSFRPDLVISNSIVIPQGAFAAALTRTPHIWFLQEHFRVDNVTYLLGSRASGWLIGACSRRIVIPSLALASDAARLLAPECIDTIRLQVSHNHIEGLHQRDFLIVGRLTDQKRQEDAIRALALLRADGADATLDLVGDDRGSFARRLRTLVKELGVEDLVHFHGSSDDPSPFYANSLATIVPSLESFGRTTIESMLSATPVIGADHGGTTHLIQHGVTGWKYRPCDVSSLALAMRAALGNREIARTMGEAGRRWAKPRFNADNFSADIIRSFQTAISQHAS